MQHIKDITPKQLMEGITGRYAHGQNMSFGYVEIKAGTTCQSTSIYMSKLLTY